MRYRPMPGICIGLAGNSNRLAAGASLEMLTS